MLHCLTTSILYTKFCSVVVKWCSIPWCPATRKHCKRSTRNDWKKMFLVKQKSDYEDIILRIFPPYLMKNTELCQKPKYFKYFFKAINEIKILHFWIGNKELTPNSISFCKKWFKWKLEISYRKRSRSTWAFYSLNCKL